MRRFWQWLVWRVGLAKLYGPEDWPPNMRRAILAGTLVQRGPRTFIVMPHHHEKYENDWRPDPRGVKSHGS